MKNTPQHSTKPSHKAILSHLHYGLAATATATAPVYGLDEHSDGTKTVTGWFPTKEAAEAWKAEYAPEAVPEAVSAPVVAPKPDQA